MSQRPAQTCSSNSILLILCLLLTASSAMHTACTRTTPPTLANVEVSSHVPRQPQTADAAPSQPPPDTSPGVEPSPADVQGALARVYHGAVTAQTSGSTPFVVGDFNGDDSQDIAIVVTPVKGKLSQLNSAYASWLVGDPQKVVPPEVRGDVQVFPRRPDPVVVRQGDLLLAVIHGYQKEGWRNPLSAQTFLLRNAVGDELGAHSARSVPASNTDRGALPQLRGDVIRERLAGEDGFIYWTGARYAWFAPAGH